MNKPVLLERSFPMIELATLQQVEGAKDQDKDIVLFALSTCPHCRHARQWLDDHEVAYRYVYVDQLKGLEQETAVAEAAKYNPNNTFPTLIIDDAVIVGFRETEYQDKM
jgi:glutaredoxin-like protein NrdH